MTDLIQRLEAGAVEDLLAELSDLQTWCALMAAKDSGGLPAFDLIQRTRIFIIGVAAILKAKEAGDA